MRVLKVIVMAIGLMAVVGFLLLYFSTECLKQYGAQPSGKRLKRIEKSSNFDGKVFVNKHGVELSFTFSEYIIMAREWFFGRGNRNPDIKIPINRLTRDDFENNSDDDLYFTWLNHSTVLIEIDEFKILTDPVWSDRVSPSSIYGPKRFHPMPLTLNDLPKIDAVVISHDHYDHLDMETVIELSHTGTRFITALGIGAHLEEWGIEPSQIIELDW